jgi:hypothetical protein
MDAWIFMNFRLKLLTASMLQKLHLGLGSVRRLKSLDQSFSVVFQAFLMTSLNAILA